MPQVAIDLVSSWGPMLLFLVAIVIVMRKGGMRARAPSGRTMIELYELQLEEMKRSTAALERVAQALEAKGRGGQAP
jgi:hypothetical protein